jgi:hypothetical protein
MIEAKYTTPRCLSWPGNLSSTSFSKILLLVLTVRIVLSNIEDLVCASWWSGGEWCVVRTEDGFVVPLVLSRMVYY